MHIINRENGAPWNTEPYEIKSGTVNVAGATPNTNLNTITGFTSPAIFLAVKRAAHITISTTGTLYVCLNSTSNDVITITSTTPYSDDFGVIYSIFVASGGVGVTVTVKLR